MGVSAARGASAFFLSIVMGSGAWASNSWQSSPLGKMTLVSVYSLGSAQTAACPEGTFIVGLEIRSGLLVDAIGAECAKLGPNGEHLQLSQTRMLGNAFGGNPRQTRCTSGQVVTAVRGRAGEFLDQVAFACRSWNATQGLHGSLRWHSPHGGQGGQPAGPLECPNGMAMTSVNGHTARSYFAYIWVNCRSLPPVQAAPAQPSATMSAQSALDPQGRPASSSPTSLPATIPPGGVTPATAPAQSIGPIRNVPVLKALTSRPVAGGAEITIDGEHFMSQGGPQANQITRVEIAGESVPYRVVSSTRITATVPAKVLDKLDRSKVPVVVTSGGQRISQLLPLR
jgi:hypothetical protein